MLVEGGVSREFEIDCTMLVCRPLGGESHIVSVGDHQTEQGIQAEATRLEQDSTMRFDLRLFEKGKPREAKYARWLTRKIRVQLAPRADAGEIAKAAGASKFTTPEFAPGFAVLSFPKIGDSLTKLNAVRQLPGVVVADPLTARKKFRRLIPNDPEFSYSGTNLDYQWHLHNTGQNSSIIGLDINVTGVWDTLKGGGVTIGIVDDGLEVAHPDLAANVNTAIDHDWNDGTPDDPTPSSAFDDHGTSCAGVAAARGNNGIGVSGAAPEASLVGLRLIANDTTDEEDGEAIGWRTDVIDISNNSWGPDDDGRDFFVAAPLISAALESGVSAGRGGNGTIYVWAAGNGRDSGDYSNYDGYNNRIETISVGSVASNGRQPWYAESGANLLVCAPSDDDFGDPGITTTTLTVNGSYTDSFGGTSSAAPLVSGVLALVLEKNPELGWRDVQEILVRSSREVDAIDSGWVNNAAGFHFNHRYGAGMIDAAAAVALADDWTNLGSQVTQSIESGALDVAISDNSEAGITQILSVDGNSLRLEHVHLTVDIDHGSRGQLEIFLTSPSGMVSQFTEVHSDGNNNIRNYTFLSVRHWGESSAGDWTVRIADRRAGSVGTLRSLSLKFYGTETLSGYALWASNHIPDGNDTGAAADIDGDGRSNLLEYALNSNPSVPDPMLNQPVLTDLGFEFKADTANTDLIYAIETSNDLAKWTSAATTVVSTSGTIETRRAALITSPLGRIFVRLKVQRD
ncbi:MAG: subtilisin family serine protease [Verrucomicrobiales bacterium]|jgi:subtilisin family serine protease